MGSITLLNKGILVKKLPKSMCQITETILMDNEAFISGAVTHVSKDIKTIKEGDVVIFEKEVGKPIKEGMSTYIFLKESEIWGIYNR